MNYSIEKYNQTGDFNCKKDELNAVKRYLTKLNIDVSECKITPHGNDTDFTVMNEGDIDVILPNGKYLLFEVKQENPNRFSKYGELGFDYISHCIFKKDVKGIHSPNERIFINSLIDLTKPCKMGKIKYSKSDVWLFYSNDGDNDIFLEGYDFKKMK